MWHLIPTCEHKLNPKYPPFFSKGTTKEGPSKAGAIAPRPAGPTQFRKFYERGDFPIAIEFDTKGNKIAWKVHIFPIPQMPSLPLSPLPPSRLLVSTLLTYGIPPFSRGLYNVNHNEQPPSQWHTHTHEPRWKLKSLTFTTTCRSSLMVSARLHTHTTSLHVLVLRTC